MAYSTTEGVLRKLTEDLYDETVVESRISEADIDTIAWINSAVRRTSLFTELELTTTADVIRLASDCYTAFRVMSDQLEGHNIEEESLAVFRYNEAKDYVRMYCAVNDIIPAFDDIYIPPTADPTVSTEVNERYAYIGGTDDICIG